MANIKLYLDEDVEVFLIIARKESPTLTLRRLLKLLAARSAEDMHDALEYLSSWPAD